MGDFAGGLLLARELIPPGSTVLCAVSGGADSVCLLHQLYRLRREVPFTLAAAHYNHLFARHHGGVILFMGSFHQIASRQILIGGEYAVGVFPGDSHKFRKTCP